MLIDHLKQNHKVRQHKGVYVVDDRRVIMVRTKTKPTHHRVTGRVEFGVPLRDWNRLCRMPLPTYLAVECGTNSYIAPIQTLDAVKRVWGSDEVDKGGSVFVPLSAFLKLKT